jgi:RNA polymerase sigma factor (sigma-70 family)
MTRGDVQLAFDATQEAYSVVLKRWSERGHLADEVNRSYVIGTALHKIIDWYRQHHRQTDLDEEADVPVEDRGYSDVLDQLSLFAAVREVIDRQPPRRRAVAVLFFLEGAEYHEIAEALRISKSTARTHVDRMRDVLEPFIVRYSEGGGHDGWT